MPQINEYSWEFILLFLIFFLLIFSFMNFFSNKIILNIKNIIMFNLKNFF